MKTIRIVCRNSNLSMIQAREIVAFFPEQEFTIKGISSYGDLHKEMSLLENVDSDFFTRELDKALLSDEADIAVHSAKDLPYPIPEGLEVIALTKALYNSDVLVSRNHSTLLDLPAGAKVGTSSPLRRNQVLKLRPDLHISSVRGTIEERLALVDTGAIDALIVAECALHRLKLSHLIAQVLPFTAHALQGKLAVIANEGNSALKSLFFDIDERTRYGKVTIAGAGPGRADLITLALRNELDNADVVFHDALIDPQFLATISAQKHLTGKRKGNHSMEQEEINSMLYNSALGGNRVVRLKGGDPSIFGRGEEEFDFLRSRLIEVDIIPGVTSALAAAASLGISLTHRDIASSVAFCTGFPADRIQTPDADTLVYYMGAGLMKEIAGKLIASGRSTATPVILISNISTPAQKKNFSTLGKIQVDNDDFETPLLMIIGEVVSNKNIPTGGKRLNVLVTGTRADRYEKLGNIIHTPLIEVCAYDNYNFLTPLLRSNKRFDAVVFTSRYAVRFFFQALRQFNHDARWFASSRIFSLGQTTSRELRQCGLEPDFQAEEETAKGLYECIKKIQFKGKNILIPHSDLARNYLQDTLDKVGYRVTSIGVYRNILPVNYSTTDLDEIDIVTFSSPSAIKNFKKIYGQLPRHVQVITLGEITRTAFDESGLRRSVLPVITSN